MSKWKKWQKNLFLVYLLLLNIIVFSALSYALLIRRAKRLPQPTPALLVDLPALPPKKSKPEILKPLPDKPAITPTPTGLASALLSTNSPHHRSTASINDSLNTVALRETTKEQQPTATQTSKPTSTPTATNTPQPSPTGTATHTPQPTATSTSTATKTPRPSPTKTATHTPQPTATQTPTATHTPRPSPTRTASPTPQPTPTTTSTATATPTNTPTATSTSSPSPTSTKTNSIPAVASAFLAVNTVDVSPARLASLDPAPISKIEASVINNNRISLAWLEVDKLSDYEVYSDMGRGYGVYVHRTRTKTAAYVDTFIHPGLNYSYRVKHSEEGQETPIAETTTILKSLSEENNLFLTSSSSDNRVAPAPTALPADAVLLGLISDNNFTDDFNTLTIAGEIRNDSSLTVGPGEISVTFYNQAGAIIETTQGKTMLETISTGETSPFLITLPRPAGMASYSLRAVARPAAARLTSQLSVEETRRFEDNIGFFHIKGTIKNVGQTTAKQVKVAAIIYGRDGRVINIGFTYVDPPNLKPGQRASYDVRFTYYPRYVAQAVIPFEE